MATQTIAQALQVNDIPISHRDAEVLLAHALGCTREYLFSHPEEILPAESQKLYEACIARRLHNEPVAYITGSKEFYGRLFTTDARALIPRPETEGVIDLAVPFLKKTFLNQSKEQNKPCPVTVLELGTGSGNIGVTLGLELAKESIPATLTLTEISAEALSLAQENYKKLTPTPNHHIVTKFIQADMFSHEMIAGKQFNLITANLPYIAPAWRMNPTTQPDVLFHEPDVALFGGDEDGLGLYRNFFENAPQYIKSHGAIIIEYGEDQTAVMLKLTQTAFPKAEITVHQDYAGLDRIIEITC